MGFTRYWTIKKEIPHDKFDEFISYARILTEYHINNGIKLASYDGTGEPKFDEEHLSLNGVGEESHESFDITRVPGICEWDRSDDGRDFCKTNNKPYDRVVYELLCLAQYIFGKDYITFSGDDDGANEEPYDTTHLKLIIRDKKIDGIINE